ncbi:hypothetical protein, partial [Brevibacterium sandarakinum]|uniref:hypothetical protein n=1 Tax=Brevibacterium sandarakinum TaxID=629680 RepID=UPI0026511C41
FVTLLNTFSEMRHGNDKMIEIWRQQHDSMLSDRIDCQCADAFNSKHADTTGGANAVAPDPHRSQEAHEH